MYRFSGCLLVIHSHQSISIIQEKLCFDHPIPLEDGLLQIVAVFYRRKEI
jgi:hypothetical protein